MPMRTVPAKGTLTPIRTTPMNPAIAETAASGST